MSNFDELMAQHDAANPEQGAGSFFDPVDTALAVPRGIIDAAKNVYGLADTLTLDALPDWTSNPLGESTSTVGGFVEGATDFMAGFLPVLGTLGKVGKLAKLGEFAAESPTLAALARGTIASGVAGFTVMDGHEQRLSNLIQQTGLANPVNEFLAAKEDDPALLGRLKSAIENSVLGLAGDSLIEGVTRGVKGLKAARAVRAKALAEGADAATADSAAHDAGVAAAHGIPEDAAGVVRTVEQAAPTSDEILNAAGLPGEDLKKSVGAMRGPARPEDLSTGRSTELVRQMGASQKDAEKFVKELKDRIDSAVDFDAAGQPVTGVNPTALTKQERFERGIKSNWLNMRHWVGTTDSDAAIRTIEDMHLDLVKTDVKSMTPVGLAEMEAKSQQYLIEVANMTGANPRDPLFQYTMMQKSGNLIRSADEMLAHTGAVKLVLEMRAQDVVEHAAALAAEGDDLTKMSIAAKLLAAKNDTTNLYGQLRGLFKSGGRVGNINRTMAHMPIDLVTKDTFSATLNDAGGLDEVVKFAKKLTEATKTNALAAHELMQASPFRFFLDATNEVWMNALLSGLKTTTVNILGPAIHSIYAPTERMLGAKILQGAAVISDSTRAAVAQSEVFHDAFAQMAHLVDSGQESLLVAKRMLKDFAGENRLDVRSGVRDRAGHAISAAGFGLSDSSIAGKAADWIGKYVVNWPTTLLSTGDEATKNWNYRSYAKAALSREGMKQGLMGEALESWKSARYKDLVHSDQMFSMQTLIKRGMDEADQVMPGAARAERMKYAVDFARKAWSPVAEGGMDGKMLSEVAQRALDYARDITFTTPAGAGSVSQGLQRFAFQHPLFRFVLPFINTPMNLVKWTGQRLDAPSVIRLALSKAFPESRLVGVRSLNTLRTRLLEDAMSGNPEKAAQAMGRIATGVSSVSFIMAKVHNGEITGRGPKDPDQRRQLLDSGWLPYAFKVGDKYISYARLDPLASLFGTVADIGDYSKYAHIDDQEKLETLGWGVAYAAANNFTNKTYLAGLSQFVDAIQNPERNLPTYMRQMGASFLPNIAGQAVPVFGDENMRDVRSLMDAWVNKTPGLSDTLPPQRNVMGEPIKRIPSLGADVAGSWVNWMMPVAATSVGDDLIKNEMVGLKHAFTTPKPEINGLNLSSVQTASGQTVYDRWQELHGEVKIGGMTLRDALRRTIKSARYQGLSDETTSDFESPRVAELNSVIREYRQRAWREVLKESPETAKYMHDHEITKRLLKSGRDTRIIPGGAQ